MSKLEWPSLTGAMALIDHQALHLPGLEGDLSRHEAIPFKDDSSRLHNDFGRTNWTIPVHAIR